MTDNIESMCEHTRNGKLRSPAQCLQECLQNIGKNGAFKNGKKLLVLCLDDNNDGYYISWAQAGMHMSECVTLCKVGEQLFLSEMGFNAMPEDL